MDNGLNGLITLLNDHSGRPISELEIGNRLQLSPNTIWKHIQILKKQGYEIDFDSNQGFSLKQAPDYLRPASIQSHLKTNFIGQDLHYFPELDSLREKAFFLASQYPEAEESMTPLKRSPRFSENPETPFAGNGSVIITEIAKRDCSLWSNSYSGINLYLGIVLRPGILPTRAAQIALVGLVALCRTIESVSGIRPEILWPDKIISSEKLLGQLDIQMDFNIDKIKFLVLNFEINANGIPDDLDPPLNQKVSSLKKISGKTINRPLLAASLLRELEKWYVTYINKGAEKIIREINHFFSFDKKEKEITCGEKKYLGIIEGLDTDGSLLMRNSSGGLLRLSPGNLPMIPNPL